MTEEPKRHSIADTLKNGFAWTVFFTLAFFLFCKWYSGA